MKTSSWHIILTSTALKSALVKDTNDILCASDDRQHIYLVLLDLNVAFDTIHHKVFISRHEEGYGIAGNVAEWMKAYLSGSLSDDWRKYKQNHDKIRLNYGFPQA